MRRHDLPGGRAQQHIADVGDLLAVGLTQPHDDWILVAALAELRGRRAGDVRLDRGRDAADRHPEHGRLRPIDANGNLRAPLFAADVHVGKPGRVLHHPADLLRHTAGVVEVVTADFHLEPAGAAVVVLTAAAQESHDLVVAAGRIGADRDARQALELATKRERDLLVGPRAFIARDEDQSNLAAMGLAASGLPVVAPAAALGHDGDGFGHALADHLLETQQRFFGALDSRADGSSALMLTSPSSVCGISSTLDQRVEQHGRDDQRRRAGDHRWAGG